MHITGAMMKVEELTGFGHGTKQRVVTAGTFFSLVKTNGGTLRVPFGRLHRTIKIKCQSGQTLTLQPLYYN